MGNALKKLLYVNQNTIDDDVLEACLTMSMPMDPYRVIKADKVRQLKPEEKTALLMQSLMGPFSSNY